ncbi:DNA repair photolyase [Bacilli bacterium PM5-9]|nr:DNA repair photolyase [Bacilli bacterium PM5-9]
MEYKKIICKSVLSKSSGRYPYKYSANIYRGCLHSCQYCYAIYSHKFLGDDNFFETIYIKENFVEELEKKLRSKAWKKEVINFGSVCDSYQPIEKELEIMRDVLKLMIKYENPIIISTKSTLILRDIDLINELSKLTFVSIAFTITSISDELNKLIEPNVPSYLDRFKALKVLKEKTNAQIGLHMMPVIPYLTCDERSIEMMFRLANKVNVDYVIVGLLNLKSQVKQHFMSFISKELPAYYNDINKYFSNKEIRKAYKKDYYQTLNQLIKKYNININYKEYDYNNKQLSIFDITKDQ